MRQEWLDGAKGGGCQIGVRKWLFLDLALGPMDQLDQVVETLRHEPDSQTLAMSPGLRSLLGIRKTA